MTIRSRIVSTGSYLPERIVTNHELSQRLDTSDEWIVERTGIRQRHIAADNQMTSDLAYEAAVRAIKDAGLAVKDLDLIILATTSPDLTFPATAVKVQARLGMTGGIAFDVQAVCSGFLYALSVADSFIRVGQVKNALVIGAETMSRLLDWKDRSTCILFGDGAGAVVLKAQETGPAGILSTHLHADGRCQDLLYSDGGPSKDQTTGYVRMSGPDVFKKAVVNLTSVAFEAMEANGVTADQIDWLVPHQANKRIIDSTIQKLKLSPQRVVVTLDRHANTSAASVPLALDEAVRDGRIQPGHLILMEAMGGGMTWGAAVARW